MCHVSDSQFRGEEASRVDAFNFHAQKESLMLLAVFLHSRIQAWRLEDAGQWYAHCATATQEKTNEKRNL